MRGYETKANPDNPSGRVARPESSQEVAPCIELRSMIPTREGRRRTPTRTNRTSTVAGLACYPVLSSGRGISAVQTQKGVAEHIDMSAVY